MTVDIRELPSWSRYRFLAGANKYIQQESTFWRRSLWEKAGSQLNDSYRDVGDFDMWVRFFRHARLYSVDALIGGYRFHSDAICSSDMERYNQRCDKIIESELKSIPRAGALSVPPCVECSEEYSEGSRYLAARNVKKPPPSGRARLAARGRRSGEQVGHSRNSVAT